MEKEPHDLDQSEESGPRQPEIYENHKKVIERLIENWEGNFLEVSDFASSVNHLSESKDLNQIGINSDMTLGQFTGIKSIQSQGFDNLENEVNDLSMAVCKSFFNTICALRNKLVNNLPYTTIDSINHGPYKMLRYEDNPFVVDFVREFSISLAKFLAKYYEITQNYFYEAEAYKFLGDNDKSEEMKAKAIEAYRSDPDSIGGVSIETVDKTEILDSIKELEDVYRNSPLSDIDFEKLLLDLRKRIQDKMVYVKGIIKTVENETGEEFPVIKHD